MGPGLHGIWHGTTHQLNPALSVHVPVCWMGLYRSVSPCRNGPNDPDAV